MRESDLTRLYPEAYHMAADRSWLLIARHGLLSTAALLERWDVANPSIRESLLQRWLETEVAIEHPEFGRAIVRDHKPIRPEALAEALIDMTPEQWFEAERAGSSRAAEGVLGVVARRVQEGGADRDHGRHRQLGPRRTKTASSCAASTPASRSRTTRRRAIGSRSCRSRSIRIGIGVRLSAAGH